MNKDVHSSRLKDDHLHSYLLPVLTYLHLLACCPIQLSSCPHIFCDKKGKIRKATASFPETG